MPRAHATQKRQILQSIAQFEAAHGALPGLSTAARKDSWADQIISSLRRIDFIEEIRLRDISDDRCDPHHRLFDPIRGAALLGRRGQLDDAIWLTFIATHFGKHVDDGWKLAANVMGSFGAGPIWTKTRYGNNPQAFAAMLQSHQGDLNNPAMSGRYSNHRQYQSKAAGTISEVFRTFNSWQNAIGGFQARIQAIHVAGGQHPEQTFHALYKSLKAVYGFGRLGNFDFLTMLGKLQLAPISPGSVYLSGATGPLRGSKLLFYDNRAHPATPKQVERQVDGLDAYLNVGKQVLEDSLCNWQKSPDRYLYFRG